MGGLSVLACLSLSVFLDASDPPELNFTNDYPNRPQDASVLEVLNASPNEVIKLAIETFPNAACAHNIQDCYASLYYTPSPNVQAYPLVQGERI